MAKWNLDDPKNAPVPSKEPELKLYSYQQELLDELMAMDDDTMLKVSKELGSVGRSSLSRRYDETTGMMVIGHVPDGPKGNYWTQPIPPKDKGVSAGPSEAKRKQLRAKRKKHKR